MKFSSHVGCPPSGAKMTVTMVSHSCLLVELGTIYNSMVASLYFKSCKATAYLKAIMEVYGKQLQVWALKKKIRPV